jgi:NAD(P)-dependent dehydrogenase (short-subunit alcohol dehydrogenase family)
MDTRLAGRVVVITGASSGFGKGAALRFAALGASVVVAARRGGLLDELARDCQRVRPEAQALAVPTDVSDAQQVEQLVSATLARFDRIDVWINNAGVGALGPFERVPLADHVQVINTDLLGTLYGCYYAYQHFLAEQRGILINVASELGRHTVPYYASYTAAKHGVVGLSDALRQEIRAKGLTEVHVCTVLPTAHDTPFFDHAANYTGHEVQAPQPLHDPEAVVDALARLATDPRDKEIVGADGVVKILLKSLAPGVSERLATRQMHSTQMEHAPPAPDSAGAVRTPIDAGTEVSGGRL